MPLALPQHGGLFGQEADQRPCLNTSVLPQEDRYNPYTDASRTRTNIPALLFSELKRTVPLPKPQGYPKKLVTIGDHIRAWRLDNNIYQSEVARRLSVCSETVTFWELHGKTPSIDLIPKIARLIGYFPMKFDTSTPGGKLSMSRHKLGLTQEKLALLIGVNESTLNGWEKGSHWPFKKGLDKIEKLFKKANQLFDTTNSEIQTTT